MVEIYAQLVINHMRTIDGEKPVPAKFKAAVVQWLEEHGYDTDGNKVE